MPLDVPSGGHRYVANHVAIRHVAESLQSYDKRALVGFPDWKFPPCFVKCCWAACIWMEAELKTESDNCEPQFHMVVSGL